MRYPFFYGVFSVLSAVISSCSSRRKDFWKRKDFSRHKDSWKRKGFSRRKDSWKRKDFSRHKDQLAQKWSYWEF